MFLFFPPYASLSGPRGLLGSRHVYYYCCGHFAGAARDGPHRMPRMARFVFFPRVECPKCSKSWSCCSPRLSDCRALVVPDLVLVFPLAATGAALSGCSSSLCMLLCATCACISSACIARPQVVVLCDVWGVWKKIAGRKAPSIVCPRKEMAATTCSIVGMLR